jgi:hypothetical protein
MKWEWIQKKWDPPNPPRQSPEPGDKLTGAESASVIEGARPWVITAYDARSADAQTGYIERQDRKPILVTALPLQ